MNGVYDMAAAVERETERAGTAIYVCHVSLEGRLIDEVVSNVMKLK